MNDASWAVRYTEAKHYPRQSRRLVRHHGNARERSLIRRQEAAISRLSRAALGPISGRVWPKGSPHQEDGTEP